MFRTLDFSPDIKLGEYSRLLWQHKISHRIVEDEQRQILLIAREDQIQEAMELLKAWQQGSVKPVEDEDSSLSGYFQFDGMMANGLRVFKQTPLTLLLIISCLVLAYFAPLNSFSDLTRTLLYPDFSYGTRVIVLSRVLENFSLLQLGKMLSPMLLHGGTLHLVFNMIWLWELGRRVEVRLGIIQFAGTVFLLALISNTAQYLFGGGNNFGGMSGVNYGLFAFIWMWQLICPARQLNLPRSLIIFMLLSLVLMTLMDLGMIADEAHIGGFLAGIIYGILTALISRYLTSKQTRSTTL